MTRSTSSSPHLTAGGKALTALILEIFRANGRLLAAGDDLVASLGLTSARWQVLGAIAYAERPEPVSWLARSMGLTRQGVQRLVNEMAEEGLVEFAPNRHHRRAHLVVLTARGRAVFDAASERQAPWVNALAKGIKAKNIATTIEVITLLRDRLTSGDDDTTR